MKVLYGINTNGQGHINRSRLVIKELKRRGVGVEAIFSGPEPPKYVEQMNIPYRKLGGYKLIYRNHSLNTFRTILANTPTVIKLPWILWKLRRWVKNSNIDLLITDFDPFTSLVGRLTRIPTISIDHQHSIIDTNAKYPKGHGKAKWLMRRSVNFASPFKHYYMAIDYVEEPVRGEKGMLYPLIWKTEFDNYDIRDDEHITVYLTHMDEQRIIDVLSQFPEQVFHVYGYNKFERKGNIEFRETSRDGFLRDMTSARGIISNSGFSTTWETILLNKKILTIPHKNQFEQIVNSHRIGGRPGCVAVEELCVEAVAQLLENHNRMNGRYSYQTIENFVDELLLVYKSLQAFL